MIDHLSFCSLYIEFYFNNEALKPLAISTGFVIKSNYNDYFLVTTWHSVTGRNHETKCPLSGIGSDPEVAKVYFHSKAEESKWIKKEIKLKVNGKKLWIEHRLKNEIDIVIIPITNYREITLYLLDEKINGEQLRVQPSDNVSIIGYPNGLTGSGKFPIWKTGNIATDVCLDWSGKPLFLIDATTRKGMSGSPVVMRKEGACLFENQDVKTGTFTRFMGIYSGRVDNDGTEIGKVWKPVVIDEILQKHYDGKYISEASFSLTYDIES